MLKTFLKLLGDDARLLHRYTWMAVAYGVLCGLTMAALQPLLTHWLQGDWRAAMGWLCVLLLGVLLSWIARRVVEQAGIRVGVAVLQSGRHRLGLHMASLPIGWAPWACIAMTRSIAQRWWCRPGPWDCVRGS